MKKKLIVLRKPLLFDTKEDKSNLIRVVKTTLGEVKIDINQCIKGRGVYIKKDLISFKQNKNKHMLDKALRCHIKEDIYLEIENILK